MELGCVCDGESTGWPVMMGRLRRLSVRSEVEGVGVEAARKSAADLPVPERQAVALGLPGVLRSLALCALRPRVLRSAGALCLSARQPPKAGLPYTKLSAYIEVSP